MLELTGELYDIAVVSAVENEDGVMTGVTVSVNPDNLPTATGTIDATLKCRFDV